jgi:hypothetical protein
MLTCLAQSNGAADPSSPRLHVRYRGGVGYYHDEEVKTCRAAGITPYRARPTTSANQKLGLFSKEDFT